MPDGGEKNNRAWGFDKLFIINSLCKMTMPDRARLLSRSHITMINQISQISDSNLFQRGTADWSWV